MISVKRLEMVFRMKRYTNPDYYDDYNMTGPILLALNLMTGVIISVKCFIETVFRIKRYINPFYYYYYDRTHPTRFDTYGKPDVCCNTTYYPNDDPKNNLLPGFNPYAAIYRC